jgi:hypothetical protein
MPCSEKRRLLEAYKATVEMYVFAVRRLDAERTNGNRAGYQDLVIIARDSRLQCDLSNEELKAHIAEHRC